MQLQVSRLSINPEASIQLAVSGSSIYNYVALQQRTLYSTLYKGQVLLIATEEKDIWQLGNHVTGKICNGGS
jgi:hypothetical protein